jgi:hypothetical protein
LKKIIADALKGFDAAQLLETGCVNPSGLEYRKARAVAVIEAIERAGYMIVSEHDWADRAEGGAL